MAIQLPSLPKRVDFSPLIKDPDILSPLEQDAAAMKSGGALGLFRPTSVEELQTWLHENPKEQIILQGSLSSLTGGATPNKDIIIQLPNQKKIELNKDELIVGSALSLHEIQEFLGQKGLFFPPAPTYDGATIGGAISTNAAGASTFKYGTTRDWITGLKLVLRSGQLFEIKRGDYCVNPGDKILFECHGEVVAQITIPTYRTPNLKKISCGYFVRDNMDLIDLFIGSEGTLAIVAQATLKVAVKPEVAVGLSFFKDAHQAILMVEELRKISERTRLEKSDGPDVKSIESFDLECLKLIKNKPQMSEINLQVPPEAKFALLYEIELPTATNHFDELALALESGSSKLGVWNQLATLLANYDCLDWTEIALPQDRKRQRQLAVVRESIPMAISEYLSETKKRDGAVHKVAGDFIVPFEHFEEMLSAYYSEAKSAGLTVAVFGHISDGNVHPNILPKNGDDVARGKLMFERLALLSKKLGGAPMSEHGVGKHPLKKKLLSLFWGDEFLNQMKKLKLGMDPNNTLGKGIYFDS